MVDVFIGGPGTRLPRPVESFLSWSLCLSRLTVSGYHYCVSIYVVPLITRIRNSASTKRVKSTADGNGNGNGIKCWIPLTTHSRSEQDRCTPVQRYHQLITMLQHYGVSDSETGCNGSQLVTLLRQNTICRRLASLAMRPGSCSLFDHEPSLPLAYTLSSIWPRLLELPIREELNDEAPLFRISIVIPAYAESGTLLETQIYRLFQRCRLPSKVEIIIVDAGGGAKDELKGVVENYQRTAKDPLREDEQRDPFLVGSVRLVEYTKGGGRGSCLNYGASVARGRILTFCHLDTALPHHWDESICTAIEDDPSRSHGRANSCAFAFGIDTSPEGLSNSFSPTSKNYHPPGITAVETTANIRTYLYSLPYGDQAISVPKHIFEFLGGFPDQCLMEDYELVALLRQRSALLNHRSKEELRIIPGPPALCSPRRWQKFGVLYVTYMNSKFVNLYSGGLGPSQLYELYYGRGPPKRESELSPWEIEMETLLDSKK